MNRIRVTGDGWFQQQRRFPTILIVVQYDDDGLGRLPF